MSQNSFIKQYLAKQQELLHERLEREAQQDEAVDGNINNHKSDDKHILWHMNTGHITSKRWTIIVSLFPTHSFSYSNTLYCQTLLYF